MTAKSYLFIKVKYLLINLFIKISLINNFNNLHLFIKERVTYEQRKCFSIAYLKGKH